VLLGSGIAADDLNDDGGINGYAAVGEGLKCSNISHLNIFTIRQKPRRLDATRFLYFFGQVFHYSFIWPL
jgi:hypothetical protein